jgi:hypothetical protein
MIADDAPLSDNALLSILTHLPYYYGIIIDIIRILFASIFNNAHSIQSIGKK